MLAPSKALEALKNFKFGNFYEMAIIIMGLYYMGMTVGAALRFVFSVPLPPAVERVVEKEGIYLIEKWRENYSPTIVARLFFSVLITAMFILAIPLRFVFSIVSPIRINRAHFHKGVSSLFSSCCGDFLAERIRITI